MVKTATLFQETRKTGSLTTTKKSGMGSNPYRFSSSSKIGRTLYRLYSELIEVPLMATQSVRS